MNSPLLDKSLDFATQIVLFYEAFYETKKDTTIAKQLLRSATSIGANINEAVYGNSKADFVSKLHIALKETGGKHLLAHPFEADKSHRLSFRWIAFTGRGDQKNVDRIAEYRKEKLKSRMQLRFPAAAFWNSLIFMENYYMDFWQDFILLFLWIFFLFLILICKSFMNIKIYFE